MTKPLILPVLLCFLVSTAIAQPQLVTLYEQCQFNGKKHTLGVGNFRASQIKIRNDRLASLKIPEGLKVTLYEHDKFDGRSVTYTSHMTCLPADWLQVTSSIVVETETTSNDNVIFYNDCYSKGYSRTLQPGTYTANQLGLLSRNISSFTINGNLRVKAYINNDNLSGYSVVHENNVSCLAKSQNDKIASLTIEYKPTPDYPVYSGGINNYATVYTNCNYSGNSLRLAPGYYPGDKLGMLKYDISSIEIPSTLKAKVYINNENMYGTSYTLSENINCLSATLNNRIASIVIEEVSGGYQYNNSPPTFEKIFLYSDANYKGQLVSLLPGTYATMNEVGFPNDVLSSLTIPQGFRVVLYEHEHFGGRTLTVTANKSSLSISGWNDKASSIAVFRDY